MRQALAPSPSLPDLRRKQILDAAAECFRQSGFSGASMAHIAKTAGMSPGHIYHFFHNKEAIIGAIVERNVAHLLELVASFESEQDILGSMVERVDIGLAEKTAPGFAGLWLEILAEAARNPKIAAMVQAADGQIRGRITHLVTAAREARGVSSRLPATVVAEGLMTLFEGLANRSVQNPALAKEEMIGVLRVAVRALLEG